MKAILFLLFIFLTSIVIKPRPKDCDCGTKMMFFYKGKLMGVKYSKTGFWQSGGYPDDYAKWFGVRFKCDSMNFSPD